MLIPHSVLRDEIQTTMRLLGVNRIDQLGPHLVSRTLSLLGLYQ
jgi:isopentenyl diphosphate isomerase/L-lactate dehydrogenase-like FMN-dependent dehydrogenase